MNKKEDFFQELLLLFPVQFLISILNLFFTGFVQLLLNSILGCVNSWEYGLGKSWQNEAVNCWEVFKLGTVLRVSHGDLSLINLTELKYIFQFIFK